MLVCFLCNESNRDVLVFNEYNFEKCRRMSQFRRVKGFKYADVVISEMMEVKGYHVNCYRKFVVLKEKYRKDYEKMFNITPKAPQVGREKICLFCGSNDLKPIFTCTQKVRDITKKLAKKLEDEYLLSKIEETDYFDYHPNCRTHFGDKCRKFTALKTLYNSMPLQQRLTAIASTSTAPEQEKPIPTLKSQPLSPTKLKVTRQSTSKPQQQQQQQQPQPVEEELQPPVREEVCLKWNTHHSNMQTAFPALLNKEQYCDVTLVADGVSLKCHKLILSSCSAYFDQVLEKVAPYHHPIIFMKDVPFTIMKALCDFMYVGEVNISQSDLDQILAVGESLKIKGLANKPEVKDTIANPNTSETQKTPAKPSKVTPKPSIPEKNESANDADITDPLDLMEPTYEEAATPDVPPPALKRNDQTRKSTGRKVRKRKHVEVDHEPSPPVFRMRKGTRSRPNVKVPRYFNANFDNSAPQPAPEPSEFVVSNETEESFNDPFMNILDEIKTEPLDIEDSMISFEEESYIDDMSHIEPNTEEYDPGPPVEEEPQKVLKKRRVSRASAATEQEKSDPLNFDHNMMTQRQVEDMELDNSESVENQEDNYHREDRLEMRIENSDRDEMPIETSNQAEIPVETSDREEMHVQTREMEEIQKENSDHEQRIADNIETVELHLQNSPSALVENDSAEAIHIENSEYEEIQREGTNQEEIRLENCEQDGFPRVIDINEMVIENSDETHIASCEDYTQIPVINSNEKPIDNINPHKENSDTPVESTGTLIGNSDSPVENADSLMENSDMSVENTNALIENSDMDETRGRNADTQGIHIGDIHQGDTAVDSGEGQDVMNDGCTQIDYSDGDRRREDSSDMETKHLEEGDVQENHLTKTETFEKDHGERLSGNVAVDGNYEEKSNSVEDNAGESNSEETNRISKENSLKEESIHSSVEVGKVLSTTEKDPLQ